MGIPFPEYVTSSPEVRGGEMVLKGTPVPDWCQLGWSCGEPVVETDDMVGSEVAEAAKYYPPLLVGCEVRIGLTQKPKAVNWGVSRSVL